MVNINLEELRRSPDIEAQNLFAVDATDRLILESAKEAIVASPNDVVTVGDNYGALTLGAVTLGAVGVRSWQDSATGKLALKSNAKNQAVPDNLFSSDYLSLEVFRGAKVVLMQLPKELAALEMLADMIAAFASTDVVVFAGGRVKHMTRRMNDVLGRYFGSVRASLAKQKSRVLIASEPRENLPEWSLPYDASLDAGTQLRVHSLPGVFATNKVDIGTRFLLSFIEEAPEEIAAADLGCGTGVLATAWAQKNPNGHILATDSSELATLSARKTLEANGIETSYEVRQDHGMLSQPDSSLDLILLNPPFHQGAGIVKQAGNLLFQEATRALRPGGRLLTVYNSHLAHRAELEKIVGPTVQLGRNSKFTVTCSTAR